MVFCVSLTSYCHRGAEGAESNKMHEAIKVQFESRMMVVMGEMDHDFL